MNKLIGKKVKMEQIFLDDRALGVTVISVEKGNIGEFKAGDMVMVSGITKGHGFQGVVKRHGFHGGPKTHGQKNRHRAPGSIGNTTPQRVLPGRRMAGRMGGVRVTTKNIPLIALDGEKKIIRLNGAVPGVRGTKVEVKK